MGRAKKILIRVRIRHSLASSWAFVSSKDAQFHEYFYANWPRTIWIIGALLRFLYAVCVAPAFAVILALLLVGLVISGKVTVIVSISVVAAWLVASLSVAKFEWINQQRIGRRLVIVLCAAILMAFIADRYVRWCLASYANSQPKIASIVTPGPDITAYQRLKDVFDGEVAAIRQHDDEIKVVPTPIVSPRSYLTFSDIPKFTGRSESGVEGSQFQPGDPLGFNIHYIASGPNPVKFIGTANGLYLEPNTNSDTQKEMLANFTAEVSKERKTNKPDFSTMMPGDRRFITAVLFTGTPRLIPATQEDLDDLRIGSKVAFIISEIIYQDNGVTHHQRQCFWLQKPASPPGIWHMCEVFNKSD